MLKRKLALLARKFLSKLNAADKSPLDRNASQAIEDDLFQRSTMSFGEHLEALRQTLVRCTVWLLLGTLIGLFLAESLVREIKSPLVEAIQDCRCEQAALKFHNAHGYPPSKAILQLICEHGLLPEIVFEQAVLTEDLLQASGEPWLDADTWKAIPADSTSQLRPRIDWRRIPTHIVALSSTEPFMTWFKAAMVAGVIVGSPGIFWNLWSFVAAGLYPHERRQVYWYLPISLGLFLAGAGLAFFVLLRLVLTYLIRYSFSLEVEFTPRLSEYLSFALFLPIGFGIAFQLPIVMTALQRLGIVTTETYMQHWRVAVMAIAFLSMILTPAEFYSMLGMFIPLTGLYFLGIALCKFLPGRLGQRPPLSRDA